MKKIFWLLAFLVAGEIAGAQTDTASASPPKQRFHKNYLRSYLQDSRDILLAPLHWKERHWITFGAMTAATALISTQDIRVYRFEREHQSALLDDISTYALEPWGSGKYSLPLLGGFYAYGFLTKDRHSKKTALLGLKAFIISSVFITPMKQIIHRHRPYHDSTDQYIFDGPFAPGTDFSSWSSIYDGFRSETKYTSFPSGHTMAAFAVASVIATEYRKTFWVPVLAYGIASLSGLSRIQSGNHWVSDVAMGAAFGVAIGNMICLKDNWGAEIGAFAVPGQARVLIRVPLD